jgi:hypothetical protein
MTAESLLPNISKTPAFHDFSGTLHAEMAISDHKGAHSAEASLDGLTVPKMEHFLTWHLPVIKMAVAPGAEPLSI